MKGLRVRRTVFIPEDELHWRFTPSGGPGGQHANKSSTRAEVTWNVENSRALGPRQRERVLGKLGHRIDAAGNITVASDRRRSQVRNREDALDRLRDLVDHALVVTPPRSATQPTKASKERRLQDKKRRSETKRLRRDLDF